MSKCKPELTYNMKQLRSINDMSKCKPELKYNMKQQLQEYKQYVEM